MGTLKVWDGSQWQPVANQGPTGPSGASAVHATQHQTGGTDPITGRLPLAVNTTSVMLGSATAPGDGGYTTAVGVNALGVQQAGGNSNTAIGYNAQSSLTTGVQNTSVGRGAGNALTTGSNNVLIGQTANMNSATNSSGVAVGMSSKAAECGSAVGQGATAGDYGVAIGRGSGAGTNCMALGDSASAGGQFSNAIGYNAKTTTNDSVVIGAGVQTTGQGAVAIGRDSIGGTAQAGTDQISLGTGRHTQYVNGKLLEYNGANWMPLNWQGGYGWYMSNGNGDITINFNPAFAAAPTLTVINTDLNMACVFTVFNAAAGSTNVRGIYLNGVLASDRWFYIHWLAFGAKA